MKVHIGSKSPTKISAIENTIKAYAFFDDASLESFNVDSEVSHQPMTLEETIAGAKNRAMNCFEGADMSFGIESGLMSVPETKTGYMNVTACVIYDGKKCHLGIASCFEYPKEATRLSVEQNLEMSHAFKEAGLTTNEKIGYAEGGIGFLTKGRLVAADYYAQAVMMAIIHLENQELF
ncbi:inosine/xanthosine triphosphatase [Candidatus Uhrbacteria bacterium]|nr:inosine/xanthosine triphosphatase [Candidatus Uhrbacteria bacterium]